MRVVKGNFFNTREQIPIVHFLLDICWMKFQISVLSAILVFAFLASSGQTEFTPYDDIPGVNKIYKPAHQDEYPEWAQLLYEYPVNYNTVIEAYQNAPHSREDGLGAINRYYKIWMRALEPFVLEDGSIEMPDLKKYYRDLNRSQLEAGNTKANSNAISNWSFLGPKETFWLNESGSADTPSACSWQVNVYSFDIAETNNNILFAGTETGFVNKTEDQGMTWELCAHDYFFGGGVSAIAIHPENAEIVYAAAGNQIHKTLDGGDTWTPLLETSGLFSANRLKIDNNDSEKLIAAANDGVHISIDGGQSWQQTWSEQCYDVDIKPDDELTVYALVKSLGKFEVMLSVDGGFSFEAAPGFPTGIIDDSGGLLATTPADPDMLLAVMLSSDYTPVLYKGNMTSDTWDLQATGQTGDFEMNNGQGYFDLVLEIDPNYADLIFVGTTTFFKTVNGGDSFNVIGGYYGDFAIHPDVQDMKILPNGDMWISTDGGFSYSTDHFTNTNNFHARNNGLIGSDMWGFDQGWNEDIVVGGRYHNGNTAIADFYQPKALRMGGAESPTGWVLQGKSRHVAFNDLGNGWILPQTSEGEPEGRFIYSKYPNMDEYGGRRGNMVTHPNYYGQLYLGEGSGFWRSDDMGVSWDLLHDFNGNVRYLQISYANPNVIYADIIGGGLYRSDDGGQTWTSKPSLTNGSHLGSYGKGKLFFAISPYDENVIYACLQNGTWSADIGDIYRSSDGGDTWDDWTGELSEYTKNLVIQPTVDGEDLIYLFTNAKNGQSAKVYKRSESESEWQLFDDNYPAGMSVNLALPFYRDSKLRVAGNSGVWESPMDITEFIPIVNPWVEKSFYNCMMDTLYFDDHSILNHEDCTWQWEIVPAPAYISDVNIRNPKVVLGAEGSYTVTLTLTKSGEVYTKSIPDMVTATTCPSIEDCDNPAGLPKDIWELIYVDSEETGDPGLAVMAFDDDPATIWHTRWSTGNDPYPHEIQIDMGANYTLYEFTILNRQNGSNGRIKDYELYVSLEDDEWGTAVSTGEFVDTGAPQTIDFDSPVNGRYFRLVALSEVNGNPWSSAAEFSFIGCNYITAVDEMNEHAFEIKAFPIPSSGIVNVSLPTGRNFDYQIFSSSGRVVREGNIQRSSNSHNFDLESCSAGIYVLRLRNEYGSEYRVKMIRE